MPTLIATELTLAQLRDRFGITQCSEATFFAESFAPYPELAEVEPTALDRVQQNYLSQFEVQSRTEETVKMVVVSPLLDIAGLYRYPFTIDPEVSIEIQDTDENGVAVAGRIDTLIVKNQLWILVVESKRSRFSVQTAVPQALAALLTKPQITQPAYALVTNGGEFLFMKLLGQESPSYDSSNTFSLLNRGNDLFNVLGVLNRIAAAL